jgi:translation initiation factor 3 subunit I
LWDVETLKEMKVYSTQTELNSACITPGKPYVRALLASFPVHEAHPQIILGGGQDAMSVTTTGSRQGKFEALFWHKLFEEEIGRVKGHLYVPLFTSLTKLTIIAVLSTL